MAGLTKEQKKAKEDALKALAETKKVQDEKAKEAAKTAEDVAAVTAEFPTAEAVEAAQASGLLPRMADHANLQVGEIISTDNPENGATEFWRVTEFKEDGEPVFETLTAEQADAAFAEAATSTPHPDAEPEPEPSPVSNPAMLAYLLEQDGASVDSSANLNVPRPKLPDEHNPAPVAPLVSIKTDELFDELPPSSVEKKQFTWSPKEIAGKGPELPDMVMAEACLRKDIHEFIKDHGVETYNWYGNQNRLVILRRDIRKEYFIVDVSVGVPVEDTSPVVKAIWKKIQDDRKRNGQR